VLVWESANGKVPKGHCITFLDKDGANCSLENLVLITKDENLQFNRNGYSNYNAELIPTLRNVVKVDIAIRKAKK
jgi:hypothetical protein